MRKIDQIHQLGQSIWYDNLERAMLKNGQMKAMIDRGDIRGVTSNPSIFEKAIAKSTAYDSAIEPLAISGWDEEKIFFQLAVEDIRNTADLFLPIFEATNGLDGFVSLEVSPNLAYDTKGTIRQVKELWKRVNRKNLMIKIPATKPGLAAIEESIAQGINVNITLIFSVKRYQEVIDAYFAGLEKRVQSDLPISEISSVASFFVSRVDTKVDNYLKTLLDNNKISRKDFEKLRGKAGIANSKMAYSLFEDSIQSDRFMKLKQKGGNIQRPLWASTSTKNPDYRDVLYAEELIGASTVNTLPPATLEAFKDHGIPKIRINHDLNGAENTIKDLSEVGIDIEAVAAELETEGVVAFEKAFSGLLNAISQRSTQFRARLSALLPEVEEVVSQLDQVRFIKRLSRKDASLWTEDEQEALEVQHRLGWFKSPFLNERKINEINQFKDEVINEGFTHCLLLGMGGSSLASEVLNTSFKDEVNGLTFAILDSTDPRQVLEVEEKFPFGKTIYIVSSKSGGTIEVQAFLKYFYARCEERYGKNAGNYFVAITDPGTALVNQARKLKFRKIFSADPNVGGRYSALTHFGLVPAALMGIDIKQLLKNTAEANQLFDANHPSASNPGLVLGAVMATAVNMGIDKLTIIAEKPYQKFGAWLEQLIAESSGKEGRGLIPIDTEPILASKHYSQDRIFYYLKNDGSMEKEIESLQECGYPVLCTTLDSPYEIGVEFCKWMIATSVLCHLIGVNAFDQPDVEDSKVRTKEKLNEYKKTGKFKMENPVFEDELVRVYSNIRETDFNQPNLASLVQNVLKQLNDGDYLAINAFLPRNDEMEKKLQAFRKTILSKTNKPSTLGFGPRFLHSTGQIHKGGPDSGVFIQIVHPFNQEVEIPEMGISFNNLHIAQSLGDYEALLNRKRRIVRIEFKKLELEKLWK